MKPVPTPKKLFTPGPLTTSHDVKSALMQDIGSRSDHFASITQNVRARLETIAGTPRLTAVLLQGSGTFGIEAMVSSLVPREKSKTLIIQNGDYSQRAVEIFKRSGLQSSVLNLDWMKYASLDDVETALRNDPSITHLYVVHFETGLGVCNPIEGIVELAEQSRVQVLIDAISTFGALPVPASSPAILGIAISANKCLHGAPGLAAVLANKDALKSGENSPPLCFDLRAQWRMFEATGQWRFTPPVQVVCAFQQALREFQREGGQFARLEKYTRLAERLTVALQDIGIVPLIARPSRAPMITTFVLPGSFPASLKGLQTIADMHGMELYPGRDQETKSFRIGCMGEINEGDIDQLTTLFADIAEGDHFVRRPDGEAA